MHKKKKKKYRKVSKKEITCDIRMIPNEPPNTLQQKNTLNSHWRTNLGNELYADVDTN